jgi:phosphonate transport system substrate-binding protein
MSVRAVSAGSGLRFALPPSLGAAQMEERSGRLRSYLESALKTRCEIVVPPSYEALAKELLGGRADVAWAPPFVCARIEAMGIRVLVRGVRGGSASYRAALLCRANEPLTPHMLVGKSAVWADKDSVGGYLLAMAFLRAHGFDPAKTFSRQSFAGSYRAALEQVLNGGADITSVFAAHGKGATLETGVDELWAEKKSEFAVVAFTEESPNDGVAVSMTASPERVIELEKTLLGLHSTPAGQEILKETFNAERFEVAPRMGYRALYRVALASL